MSERLRLERVVASLRGRDGDLCFYCGKEMEFDRPPAAKLWTSRWRATVEHLIDRKDGGTRHHTNAVLAHRKCNSDRSQMNLEQKIASRSIDAPRMALAIQKTISAPEKTLREMRKFRQSSGNEGTRP